MYISYTLIYIFENKVSQIKCELKIASLATLGRPGAFTFYCDIFNYFGQDFSDIALAFGLSSELSTLCGQLARRSTAKLCHNQVHMTCGSAPLLYYIIYET